MKTKPQLLSVTVDRISGDQALVAHTSSNDFLQ